MIASPLVGSPEYLQLLEEMRVLHIEKSIQYGSSDDPLANLYHSLDWGVRPWHGALIRMGDKYGRVQQMCQNGSDPILMEDNLMDLAAYALLALVLIREERRLAIPAVQPLVGNVSVPPPNAQGGVAPSIPRRARPLPYPDVFPEVILEPADWRHTTS